MGSFPQVDPRFDKVMETMKVPLRQHGDHRKWVRFYLHFCCKYGHDAADARNLPLFLDKLKSKGQTEEQRDCARDAVELYRTLLAGYVDGRKEVGRKSIAKESPGSYAHGIFSQGAAVDSASEQVRPTAVSVSCARRSRTTRLLSGQNPEVQLGDEKSSCNSREEANAGWRDVEAGLKNEIMLRHYSPKTFKSYRMWLCKFRGFLVNKNPSGLTGGDVKAFLTDMAVKRGFSASAQNQAFNALLFVFRHVLKRELGDLSDTPRAKRSKYVPTVLSGQTIQVCPLPHRRGLASKIAGRAATGSFEIGSIVSSFMSFRPTLPGYPQTREKLVSKRAGRWTY